MNTAAEDQGWEYVRTSHHSQALRTPRFNTTESLIQMEFDQTTTLDSVTDVPSYSSSRLNIQSKVRLSNLLPRPAGHVRLPIRRLDIRVDIRVPGVVKVGPNKSLAIDPVVVKEPVTKLSDSVMY